MTAINPLYRPCVGLMLVNEQGQIFMGKRFKQSAWQMPQGGIEPHEDIKTAACRELYEETGITQVKFLALSPTWYYYDIPRALRPPSWQGQFKGQGQKWCLLQFLGQDEYIRLNVNLECQEFDAWCWASKDTVVSRVVAFKQAVYKRVMNDFSPIICEKILKGQ